LHFVVVLFHFTAFYSNKGRKSTVKIYLHTKT